MASDDEGVGKGVSFQDTDVSHQSEDYGKYHQDSPFHFSFGQVCMFSYLVFC